MSHHSRRRMAPSGLFVLAAGLLSGPVVAQQDAVFVDPSGNVGIGTDNPTEPLHVVRTPAPGTNLTLFKLENLGAVRFDLWNNNIATGKWFFQADQDGTFKFSKLGTGGPEIIVAQRLDATPGKPTLFVDGSIQATNVVFSSSRALKADFEQVNKAEILQQLSTVAVESWRYRNEGESVRHIGPTAEDFYSAFGLGGTDEGISTADAYGVALAAIQALHAEVDDRDARIERLEKELQHVRSMLQQLLQRQDPNSP